MKPKKIPICKSINPKTKGYGCGTNLYKKPQYGLCPKCLYKWTLETEEGKEWFDKQTAYKKKKNDKDNRIQARKDKAKAKLDLISTDKYRSKYLQPAINKIVRLIDYGNPCIATGNYGKMNAGHYVSVGANRTTSMNLHNIFIQSFESNHFRSGDNLKYQSGLIRTFGDDYYEFINTLTQHRPVKLKKYEMIELRSKCLEIAKTITEIVRTPVERIELRNMVNNELGIYDLPFSEYIKK